MYPVMMSFQIHARGSGFFLIKMVQYGSILSLPKYVIINLKINNIMATFPQ